MYGLKLTFLLLGALCSAEDPAFSDIGKRSEGPFPWKTDRFGPLRSDDPSDSIGEKKNRENSSLDESPKAERGIESIGILDAGGGGGKHFENQTDETRYYERHERPRSNGSGFRKRIDRDENYDYLYEYESGDYYWKSKSVRVVSPKKKNLVAAPKENPFSTVPQGDIVEKELPPLEPTTADEISNFEKSKPRFDLVEFDEKFFSCPDNINETYPITGYCNRYVACVSGKPYPKVCRGGLHFDLLKKTCDLPSNSFCNYACPKEEGYFGIPGECNGFFSCRNWYPRYRTCPPHKHWDPEKEICSDEESSPCPLKCNVPYEVKPYEGDCRSYVICEKSLASYRRCPADTRFDLESLGCVPRNSTECSPHPKLMTFKDYSEKSVCASIGFKGELFTWCKETSLSTSAPDIPSTSDF